MLSDCWDLLKPALWLGEHCVPPAQCHTEPAVPAPGFTAVALVQGCCCPLCQLQKVSQLLHCFRNVAASCASSLSHSCCTVSGMLLWILSRLAWEEPRGTKGPWPFGCCSTPPACALCAVTLLQGSPRSRRGMKTL